MNKQHQRFPGSNRMREASGLRRLQRRFSHSRFRRSARKSGDQSPHSRRFASYASAGL